MHTTPGSAAVLCLCSTSHLPSEGADSGTLYGCRRDTIEGAAPASGSAARAIENRASTVEQQMSAQPLLHSAAAPLTAVRWGKMGPLEQYAQLRPPAVLQPGQHQNDLRPADGARQLHPPARVFSDDGEGRHR